MKLSPEELKTRADEMALEAARAIGDADVTKPDPAFVHLRAKFRSAPIGVPARLDSVFFPPLKEGSDAS